MRPALKLLGAAQVVGHRARAEGPASPACGMGSDGASRLYACAGASPTKEDMMPLYFFDSGDGECFLRGDAGVELPGPQEARDEAVRLLPSIAHDMGLGYHGQDIVSMVRNERNQVIFKATLSLRAEWLVAHPEEEHGVREPSSG